MSSVLAAELSGTIYNTELNIAKDVLVIINTTPQQRFLAKEGTYSFQLFPGDYMIQANYYEGDDSLTSTEYVHVKDEGSYLFDLFLLPDISSEDILQDEVINVELDQFLEESRPSSLTDVLIRLFMVLLVLGFFYYVWKNLSKKSSEELQDEDGLGSQVLALLKREGGRISQKDLRKQFPHSEAKISLIITELVNKEKIEKIKRGRSNVLILKK